jgi:hypothetical protein
MCYSNETMRHIILFQAKKAGCRKCNRRVGQKILIPFPKKTPKKIIPKNSQISARNISKSKPYQQSFTKFLVTVSKKNHKKRPRPGCIFASSNERNHIQYKN